MAQTETTQKRFISSVRHTFLPATATTGRRGRALAPFPNSSAARQKMKLARARASTGDRRQTAERRAGAAKASFTQIQIPSQGANKRASPTCCELAINDAIEEFERVTDDILQIMQGSCGQIPEKIDTLGGDRCTKVCMIL